MLTNASEPARTRSPMQPSESEIAAARAKLLGSQTFQLLDVEYLSNAFHPEANAGHAVNAKGFLIRTGTDVRTNVTWVEMLAGTICHPVPDEDSKRLREAVPDSSPLVKTRGGGFFWETANWTVSDGSLAVIQVR